MRNAVASDVADAAVVMLKTIAASAARIFDVPRSEGRVEKGRQSVWLLVGSSWRRLDRGG